MVYSRTRTGSGNAESIRERREAQRRLRLNL